MVLEHMLTACKGKLSPLPWVLYGAEGPCTEVGFVYSYEGKGHYLILTYSDIFSHSQYKDLHEFLSINSGSLMGNVFSADWLSQGSSPAWKNFWLTPVWVCPGTFPSSCRVP